MPPPYTVTYATFDGAKFATRYALNPTTPDFWMQPLNATQGSLHLRAGVTLPDDPPIFDPPDAPNITNQKIINEFLTTTDARAVLSRAIVLTIMDAMNTVRARLQPPLAPLTKQQVLTALTNKVNSGEADAP